MIETINNNSLLAFHKKGLEIENRILKEIVAIATIYQHIDSKTEFPIISQKNIFHSLTDIENSLLNLVHKLFSINTMGKMIIINNLRKTAEYHHQNITKISEEQLLDDIYNCIETPSLCDKLVLDLKEKIIINNNLLKEVA